MLCLYFYYIFFCIHRQLSFTTLMLISYNNQIGNATNISVNISDVGVITAAMIRIATITCLRKRRISAEFQTAILPMFLISDNSIPIPLFD